MGLLVEPPPSAASAAPRCPALPAPRQPPAGRQPCDDITDPLQKITGVQTIDAYAELRILPPRLAQLRGQTRGRLQKADAALPGPFSLVVLDTWRTMGQQQALRDHYRAKDEHVASVDPAAMRPPHTTGAAVDLTLGYRGAALALGTDYDAFSDEARLSAFEDHPDDDRCMLRRLLGWVMLGAGFAPYEPEWWHWSYGDDVWASANGCNALYEIRDAGLS